MRLRHIAAGPADLGLDVSNPQLSDRNTEKFQREVLGDGVILAVARPLQQRFNRCRPVIVLSPVRLVIDKLQFTVEKLIDVFQLLLLGTRFVDCQDVAPTLDDPTGIAAVALLGGLGYAVNLESLVRDNKIDQRNAGSKGQ